MESSRKLLEVLLQFDSQKPVMAVSELAESVGLPLSSTYRYVGILRDVGLLEADPQGGYRVGARILPIAQAARDASASLLQVVRPVMQKIQIECGETVLLVRREGNSVHCVDRVESDQAVRLSFDPGQPMRLHEGSSARVLLAAMPLAERSAYLDRLRESGIALTRRLEAAELDRVNDEGWTESFEEVDQGIWGTAAAIQQNGVVVAALGCAGPLYRLGTEQREAIIRAVREGAQQVSEQLTRAS